MINLDLFSGVRGWEVFGGDLGLRPTLGIELNALACATSRAAGFTSYRADVAALDPRDFGPVHGIMASPPCQSYSLGGKRAGRQSLADVLLAVKLLAAGESPRELLAGTGDPDTGLVIQPLHWALTLRPEWLAWEQVPGVLPVWQACADVLRSVGYHAVTGVLRAEEFGVPQTRRRAFLLAHRRRPVALPEPTHPQPVAVADAINLPPAALLGFLRKADRPKGIVIVDGQPYRSRDLRSASLPAFSVTSKVRSWQVFDDSARRQLTVDEAGILQSFPSGYPWQGLRTQATLQVANAIPPLLARAVLEAIL